MKSEEQDKIRSKFENYKNDKILIYGTGKRAGNLIDALNDFHIVGVVDKDNIYGEFKKKPILVWDEIRPNTAELLIIAADRRYYEEIFRRIQDKCIVCKLTVLGYAGEDLGIYFGNEIDRIGILKYCEKNVEDLKKKIQFYDAISFDVFDTLIMRKTLEPGDVFDLVEKNIKKKGIQIDKFKRKRKEADHLTPGGTIEEIYDTLQKMLHLSCEQRNIILQEELQCEGKVLMPRYDMVGIMQYAFSLGKRVSLISDMYMPEKLMTGYLHRLGIKEFHKLYVSCDYRTGKGERLFEIYCSEVEGQKCLHIGDDIYADIRKPTQYGIDTYEVKSAYGILKISEMHGVIGYINNMNEKNLIGLLISDLFNSPFSLYHTYGILKIRELELFGKLFFFPLVIKYLSELFDYLNKNNQYEGILFAARDGHLFHKLYEKMRQNTIYNLSLPRSVYFITSRKLALRATMGHKDIMRVLKNYLGVIQEENILKSVAGLDRLYEKKDEESGEAYIERHEEKIKEKSASTLKNYNLYLKREKINLEKKYLFCELDSQGTTQYALNYLFTSQLDGFYMSRYYTDNIYDLSINAIFESERYVPKIDMVVLRANLQEMVFTSASPSVQDMDGEGYPIYDKETRDVSEIGKINRIQKEIEKTFEEYIDTFYVFGETISNEITEFIYRLSAKSILEDECVDLNHTMLYDNLLNNHYNVWSI